jgi:hypothetical protein
MPQLRTLPGIILALADKDREISLAELKLAVYELAVHMVNLENQNKTLRSEIYSQTFGRSTVL